MTCLVSTKLKEIDGSFSVLVTCLGCGYSVRVSRNFGMIICLNCNAKLIETKYLSQKALFEKIKVLEKEINQELIATSKTVVAGFSPAKPFRSYRLSRQRLQRISALPKKIKAEKK